MKLTHISSRKDFGHRYTSRVSVPFFRSKWAISFSLPLGGSFTSCTDPFIFVSVRRSYLGGPVSGAFCARIGTRHRAARHTGRNRIPQAFDGRDSLTRMTPFPPEAPVTVRRERPRRNQATLFHYRV